MVMEVMQTWRVGMDWETAPLTSRTPRPCMASAEGKRYPRSPAEASSEAEGEEDGSGGGGVTRPRLERETVPPLGCCLVRRYVTSRSFWKPAVLPAITWLARCRWRVVKLLANSSRW